MDRRVSLAARPSYLQGVPVKFCSSCGSAMAFSDQHPSCIACLGMDHAVDSLLDSTSCPACARFDRQRLRERLNKARRAHGGEGTQVVDPEVWPGARRADRPHGHDLPWSGPRRGLDPDFSPPHRDGGGAARLEQSSRRPPLNPFINPEPPADQSDYSQSFQPGSGDGYFSPQERAGGAVNRDTRL